MSSVMLPDQAYNANPCPLKVAVTFDRHIRTLTAVCVAVAVGVRVATVSNSATSKVLLSVSILFCYSL